MCNFKIVTEQLISNIENSATELGRPIVYLSSAKDRKEDLAKAFLLSDPVKEGLICVWKTLESCKTAKVVGGGEKNISRSRHGSPFLSGFI